MKRILRNSLLAAWLLAAAAAAAAQALVAGKDYLRIEPPQPTASGKAIEVLEFFWYACPHCNNLQPALKEWLKRKPSDVEFRREPAVLQQHWVPLTQAYHALDAMGLVEKLHYEVFAAIHQHKIRLSEPNVLFDWVAKQGVDRQKFVDTYNSFGVRSRTQRSIDLSTRYDIPGTPAIAVDGRYLLSPSLTLKPDNSVDYERFFKVLDQAIAMARKARAGK